MLKKIGNTLYNKMLDRYESLETVFGIWVPSRYAFVVFGASLVSFVCTLLFSYLTT